MASNHLYIAAFNQPPGFLTSPRSSASDRAFIADKTISFDAEDLIVLVRSVLSLIPISSSLDLIWSLISEIALTFLD